MDDSLDVRSPSYTPPLVVTEPPTPTASPPPQINYNDNEIKEEVETESPQSPPAQTTTTMTKLGERKKKKQARSRTAQSLLPPRRMPTVNFTALAYPYPPPMAGTAYGYFSQPGMRAAAVVPEKNPIPEGMDVEAVVLLKKMERSKIDMDSRVTRQEVVEYLERQGWQQTPVSELPRSFNAVIESDECCVGADKVAEVVCYKEPEIETFYCTLCYKWLGVVTMIRHLKTIDHALKYFESIDESKAYEIRHILDSSLREAKIRQISKEFRADGYEYLCTLRMNAVMNRDTLERFWPEYKQELGKSKDLLDLEFEPKLEIVEEESSSSVSSDSAASLLKEEVMDASDVLIQAESAKAEQNVETTADPHANDSLEEGELTEDENEEDENNEGVGIQRHRELAALVILREHWFMARSKNTQLSHDHIDHIMGVCRVDAIKVFTHAYLETLRRTLGNEAVEHLFAIGENYLCRDESLTKDLRAYESTAPVERAGCILLKNALPMKLIAELLRDCDPKISETKIEVVPNYSRKRPAVDNYQFQPTYAKSHGRYHLSRPGDRYNPKCRRHPSDDRDFANGDRDRSMHRGAAAFRSSKGNINNDVKEDEELEAPSWTEANNALDLLFQD